MANQTITYQIAGGLTSDQIQSMHTSALQLVEQVGISVPHRGILALLSGQKGVSIHGEVVCFQPEVVERAMRLMCYPEWANQLQWGIISGAYEMNVLDGASGQLRPATTDDLRQATRLCESLGMLGSAPILPQDIASPELREIALYKISYENSARKSSDLFDANPKSSPETAEIVYEMAQAAGRYFSVGVMVISPLRMMESELEIIYRFLDRKVPMMVTALPSAGATGPYPLVGAHVQSLAEVMAAMTTLTLVSRGAPVYASPIDSIRAHPFDMKQAAFVYGSPEDLLGTLIQSQLNRQYGIPVVAKSLLTNSPLPDEQAAAEKSAHTLAAALAGARIFTNAGVLAVDEIYSFEQALIDYEIVQYCRRVCAGFEFSPEALGVEAVIETGIGGNFLMHPTTLTRYKTGAWQPQLFDHTMLSQWQSRGSRSLMERAGELVRKRLAQPGFKLPAGEQHDLDRIWQSAVKRFS